jgi:hypothetical protein
VTPLGLRCIIAVRCANNARELDVVNPAVESTKSETDGATRVEERVVLSRGCYGNAIDVERARDGRQCKLQLVPEEVKRWASVRTPVGT